jgi:hypothetical protein
LSDWQPATEAEAMMRDALAASDQEHYFRVLSRMDLLLPVSAEALSGRAPMGWGTWTTGNRTHVLAFTSPYALQVCLNEPSASYRTIPFHSLAADWPNYEWWLAVNPGLPIEAYLPSWFVSQLTRGDVRMPGRTMGARSRVSQSDLTAALNGRMRATTPAGPVPIATASTPIPHGPGGFTPPHDPFVETVDAELIDPEHDPGEATSRFATPPVVPGYPPEPPSSYAPPSPSSFAAAPPPSSYTPPASYAAPAYPPSNYGAGARSEPPPAARPGGGSSFDEPTIIAPIRPSGPRPRPATAEPQAYPADGSFPGDGTRGADRDFTPVVGRNRETHDAEIIAAVGPTAGPPKPGAASAPPGFVPANETEANLLAAAETGNTDAFLSTLLLARIIVPVPAGTPAGAHPRDRSFPWRIDDTEGQRFIAVFTSPERLAEHSHSRYGREMSSVSLRFVQLIGAWPSDDVGFAINPGSPVGATLPGSQIVALASWAAEVGLRDEPSAELAIAAKKTEATPSASSFSVAGAPAAGADRATVMQRTVPPAQLPFYVERGYDRVSGFVNRASEVAHLTSPKALFRALGLVYSGSPFAEDDHEAHVLRWVAHRSDLYRLPYGGQHEAAMRAMQGWVVERAPFRGNGFAPGDTDVVAEFKVDSIRLPHGAQLWRLSRDGNETLVATFDADATRWVPAPLGYSGGRYA